MEVVVCYGDFGEDMCGMLDVMLCDICLCYDDMCGWLDIMCVCDF